jgi:hypothetical protein
MTIIVSVKINDGIVMAADSALSFPGITPPQIYEHANKIMNLRKGLPIGIMSTGDGGIGNESLETLFKDLRRRLSGEEAAHADWNLDPATYTLEGVARRVRQFLFSEKLDNGKKFASNMLIRICGYGAGQPLAETWHVVLSGNDSPEPQRAQGAADFGPLWNGEIEALDRLLFGISGDFVKAAVEELKLEEAVVIEARRKLTRRLYATLYMNAMPIGDAIELARFLVDTTAGFVKFALGRAKTVGGAIEIAAITKHEGFKWIQRKHFFDAEFNPPTPHADVRPPPSRRPSKSRA